MTPPMPVLRRVPVLSPQVFLTPFAKRTIQPFAKTPRLPESSMSTRLGNSSTRVGFSPFVSVSANHITESPNMLAKNTQLESVPISVQLFSAGVSAAMNTSRPSSSETDASPTVTPFSIRQPSLCLKVVATATISIFFSTSLAIEPVSSLRPKQSLLDKNTTKIPATISNPKAAHNRKLNN